MKTRRSGQKKHREVEPPPWVGLFGEVAIRAMLKLHHQYLTWSRKERFHSILPSDVKSDGLGVAFADERTVCAAIHLEALSSMLLNGVRVLRTSTHKKGPRYYSIEGEVPYPGSENLRADFRVRRVTSNGNARKGKEEYAYIEAKRAYLCKPGGNHGSYQRTAIAADISQLRKKLRGRLDRGFIMVWGVVPPGPNASKFNPVDFLSTNGLKRLTESNGAKSEYCLWALRATALPHPVSLSTSREVVVPPTKDAPWLWLALAEVTSEMSGGIPFRSGS